jgi:hypothetical protein
MDISGYTSFISSAITNQVAPYSISPATIGSGFTNVLSFIPIVTTVDTYSAMIAKGSSALYTSLYRVKNDENKNITDSTYIWYTDGKRIWIATTSDN